MIKRTYPSWRYRYGGSAHTYRSRYRYGGSGIFSNLIGRRLIGDSVKNLINKVIKSKISQKAAEVAVKGATSVLKPKVIGQELVSAAINNFTENRRRKRERQDIINSVIQQLSPKEIPPISSVEEIINSGKGIVYD